MCLRPPASGHGDLESNTCELLSSRQTPLPLSQLGQSAKWGGCLPTLWPSVPSTTLERWGCYLPVFQERPLEGWKVGWLRAAYEGQGQR